LGAQVLETTGITDGRKLRVSAGPILPESVVFGVRNKAVGPKPQRHDGFFSTRPTRRT